MLLTSHSVYDGMAGGEIQFSQSAPRSQARIAFGLFTVIFLFDSIVWPPLCVTCHSVPMCDSDSLVVPGHTNPQKSFFPSARSLFRIFTAICSRSSQVLGGALYPYL